jgi:hypothetical protein
MDDRLPAHLEVAAILRLAETLGGFGAVLARGERDAGTILLVMQWRGEPATAYERMPQPGGPRRFAPARREDPTDPGAFAAYLERRRQQDPDIWLIEVNIAEEERFVARLDESR